jgi:hypothetical protein
MESNFVPYQIAVDMKSIGFDELCFGWYAHNGVYNGYSMKNSTMDELNMMKNSCSTPLYQQAFRWFREKYGLFVSPNVISYEDGPYLWFFEINSTVLPFGKDLGETDDYKTYKEAELECLVKLISIVKEKKL